MRMMKLLVLLTAAPLLSYASDWTVPDLNIGKANLNQTVIKKDLSEGATLYEIKRGAVGKDGYILSTGIITPQTKQKYINELKALNIPFEVNAATETAPLGTPLGPIIRIKGFNNQNEAKAKADKLQAKGLEFSVRYSAQEGMETTGPFDISILKIDLNRFDGKIINALAKDKIQGAESVTSMVDRKKAIAGVNGGFFAFDDSVGDYGAPAGIYVNNGELIREATNNRPVIIFDNSGKKTQVFFGTSVETQSFITQGDFSYQINGINRTPGKLLNCGGNESKPTEKPVHDFVCNNDSEIIVYNSMYGNNTPQVRATEIILNKRGDIVSYSDVVNTKIESDKNYIQLTGNKKLVLKEGLPVKLVHKVFVDNKEFTLKPGITMISAGPSLLVDGNIPIEIRAAQGWEPYPKIKDLNQSKDDDGLSLTNDSENREGFYEGWVLRRHPRTAIGITKENILFIAVVYGRNPTHSEGATITEMGRLMKALGAVTAMNLDGGGSSVMIVDGKPTGTFSDEKERLVSDAILLIKKD
ncbi:phosphodiester glycosidase family protein [Providencia sp. Me31A]|uniref:phosphodiester glycosidase family protein n=1 Tax=Providencia sp. Me31A TaxID=3392637 RepID=UPI003D2C39CA